MENVSAKRERVGYTRRLIEREISEDSRGVSRRVNHLVLDPCCKFHKILVRREIYEKYLQNFRDFSVKEKEETNKNLVLWIGGRRCCQNLEVLPALLGSCAVACRCGGRKKKEDIKKGSRREKEKRIVVLL